MYTHREDGPFHRLLWDPENWNLLQFICQEIGEIKFQNKIIWGEHFTLCSVMVGSAWKREKKRASVTLWHIPISTSAKLVLFLAERGRKLKSKMDWKSVVGFNHKIHNFLWWLKTYFTCNFGFPGCCLQVLVKGRVPWDLPTGHRKYVGTLIKIGQKQQHYKDQTKAQDKTANYWFNTLIILTRMFV